MSERLQDKAAVVTGAAGGIGAATVARLTAEGARVLAADVDAQALAALAAAAGGELVTRVVDVTRESEVAAMLEAAAAHFGGLDCLFNNAGIEGVVAPIGDYPSDVYARLMAVNVDGVFFGCKHAVAHLRARGGGAIVNTASVAGLRGSAFLPAYCASKHAVIGITRATAEAYGRDAIRCNAVCPSPIETRMMRSLERGLGGNEPDVVKARFEGNIPLGRYGEPHEVAALVAFLLSDEARYITGSSYAIDGGLTPV